MTDQMSVSRADAKNVGQQPVQLCHLIGGRWQSGSGDELVDVNPGAPSDVVAVGNLAGTDDVDEAVSAARAAASGWADLPFPGRGAILRRAGDILDAHAEQWGRELSREEGKALVEGIGEVRRAAEICRFFASEAMRPVGEMFASPRPGETIHTIQRPVGTVAVITPFNFPIGIPAWKIVPALAYGNTVVWKPASSVPLLAMRLAFALTEAGLPDGVLSLLFGERAVGEHLYGHPNIDAVTFTGSTEVGRSIIAGCGALGRPVQTEMGGKNAAAVLSDADLDTAVAQVISGAFGGTGQRCTATSRVIVAESVADDFIGRLVEQANRLVVGDQTDSSNRVGPMVSVAARDAVVGAVSDARARPGVRHWCGGTAFQDDARSAGAFISPAVLELTADVSEWAADPLWRSELFGPVLTVRRAPDDDTALELVNDSVFGLSAAVFTDDLRAVSIAQRVLDVGVLHINSETGGAEPYVPFGGTKESGFGPKEQGRAAREFYTKTMTVYLTPSSAT